VRIRRVETSGGFAVTTVGAVAGGDGFAGDYGPVSGAVFDSAEAIFFANGHLYIADTANSAIRVVQ
jgi:hypothetical protein